MIVRMQLPQFEWFSARRHQRIVCLALMGLMAGSGFRAHAGPAFANGEAVGVVASSDVTEASGLAASRNNPGVFWTHNDSGSPRLFAIDSQGRLLATYKVPSAGSGDYEDVAIGPGPTPGVDYLYFGDIGDNASARDQVKVYRIPEPAVYPSQYLHPVSDDFKGDVELTLGYPSGTYNSETLMVDPISGDIFVGSKQAFVTRIFRAPRPLSEGKASVAMTLAAEVPFAFASGGDISVTGQEIALRREEIAVLWKRSPGQSIAEALQGDPVQIPVVGPPIEPNGEGIAFDATGANYYTISEGPNPVLYFFRRTSSDGPAPVTALIQPGSDWKYLDDGTDQGTAWRSTRFDDSRWLSGSGQFGYGDGDEQTVISFGPDASSKYVTTYFRKTFQISDPAAFATLALKMVYDDGAAVYLNGTEVVRANLDAGATYRTKAIDNQSDYEATWFAFALDPRLLVPGSNTLAVEVHQQGSSDKDVSFDLQLIGSVAPQKLRLQAVSLSQKGELSLSLSGPDGSYTVEASSNIADWQPIGSVKIVNSSGAFVDGSAGASKVRFYRAVSSGS